MSEILDVHVEWAVVDRLRRMLEAPPHPEFNVTHTYALFTAILCWTTQRIRTKEKSVVDQLASAVLKRLQLMKVEDPPWSIMTDRTPPAQLHGVGLFPKFRGLSADRFIVALRNATAHGDARSIKPFHSVSTVADRRSLTGFTFDCSETKKKNGKSVVIWSGSITLLERDLRRIGIGLAEFFCHSLQMAQKESDAHAFVHDATEGVTEKAA